MGLGRVVADQKMDKSGLDGVAGADVGGGGGLCVTEREGQRPRGKYTLDLIRAMSAEAVQPENVTVFEPVSVEISRTEMVSVAHKNGAGKTRSTRWQSLLRRKTDERSDCPPP